MTKNTQFQSSSRLTGPCAFLYCVHLPRPQDLCVYQRDLFLPAVLLYAVMVFVKVMLERSKVIQKHKPAHNTVFKIPVQTDCLLSNSYFKKIRIFCAENSSLCQGTSSATQEYGTPYLYYLVVGLPVSNMPQTVYIPLFLLMVFLVFYLQHEFITFVSRILFWKSLQILAGKSSCINCAETKIIYKHLVVRMNLSIMKVQIFGQFYIRVSYPCQTKIQYKTMVLFNVCNTCL